MPMYNLIEYSNIYSDPSESLWKLKRDEVFANNADLAVDNSESCKYKAILLGKTANHNNEDSFIKAQK